jgi:hypothetical protein
MTVLSLAVISVHPAPAASTRETDVVQMPRFDVKQSKGHFDFDVRYDDDTNRVQEVKLAWVSPAAVKDGLRVGDRLISIDGKPVIEFVLRDALELIKRELKPGESRIIVFTGTRMLRRVTITYTTKGPNKAPPTSTRTPEATMKIRGFMVVARL